MTQIKFEYEPEHYEIRIWTEDDTSTTYGSLEEIKEKGKVLLEILAHWPQGQGQGQVMYTAGLDIQ